MFGCCNMTDFMIYIIRKLFLMESLTFFKTANIQPSLNPGYSNRPKFALSGYYPKVLSVLVWG